MSKFEGWLLIKSSEQHMAIGQPMKELIIESDLLEMNELDMRLKRSAAVKD